MIVKILVIALVVILPVVGFFLGWTYPKPVEVQAPIQIVSASPSMTPSTVVNEASPTPEPLVCDKVLCIKDGAVTYTNEQGEKKVIAKNVNDPKNPVQNTRYKFADLSPNKKFIALGGTGWEWVLFEVYDIETGQTHPVDATASNWGYWLYDNRLLVLGECGMGIDCGTYLSKSGTEPWVMEKVGDSVYYGRTIGGEK